MRGIETESIHRYLYRQSDKVAQHGRIRDPESRCVSADAVFGRSPPGRPQRNELIGPPSTGPAPVVPHRSRTYHSPAIASLAVFPVCQPGYLAAMSPSDGRETPSAAPSNPCPDARY